MPGLINLKKRESGQSMIETVVVLPVILLLFLGLWFFKDIVDARINAVQAARYLTWESVWNAREKRTDRAIKENNTLKQELINVGLGRHLVQDSVQGAQKKRSLRTYASEVSAGAQGGFADVPQFITNFIATREISTTDSSHAQGSNNVPGFDSLGGVLDPIISLGGDASFLVHDLFAGTTLWKTEADEAVYTSFVTYQVKGTSVFRFLGDTSISQTGSILGHPLNVMRSNDNNEFAATFGQDHCIEGSSARGHIFDLWLFPSGGFPGISDALGAVKCVVSEIGSVLGLGNATTQGNGSVGIMDIIGGDLGFKLPDGTHKEYPELHP
jgi:hypothetical protein